jgi:hypothetical protein
VAAVRAVCRDLDPQGHYHWNIHGGVAIRSDVANLRDGNSCLRDVVGVFEAAMGSQRKQKDLKRKLQLIMDVHMAATEGIHTHVDCVKGTGGSELLLSMLRKDWRQMSCS